MSVSSFAFTFIVVGVLLIAWFRPTAESLAAQGSLFTPMIFGVLPPFLALLSGLHSARVAWRLEELRQRRHQLPDPAKLAPHPNAHEQ